MPSATRRALVAGVSTALAGVAGCTSLGGSAAEVTIENARETEYRMTAYLIEESVDAGNVTFRATNETGVRTTVERLRFETDGPYYNASVSPEWNATERQVVVPPGETRTATFDAWDPGTTIVYMFEAPDGRVVRSTFVDCPDDSLRHTFVFSDGPENGHRATCS